MPGPVIDLHLNTGDPGVRRPRDARNRQDFVDGIRGLLGVEPEVITGDAEAALSFAGASSVLPSALSGSISAVGTSDLICRGFEAAGPSGGNFISACTADGFTGRVACARVSAMPW